MPGLRLRFRVPTPTEEELTRHYKTLRSDSLWRYGLDRPVWREIARMVESTPERSVLDVGCFRGDLLNFLGESWKRAGIEPASSARQEAQALGIEILASSVEGLEEDGRYFGAITLVDVIEHLTCPLEALEKLTRMLLPGGSLVVFTGSTDAWSWRLSGVDYWYCALPEHVAFFSPRWFRWAAPRIGVELRTVRRLPHRSASRYVRLDEAAKNLAFIMYRRLEKCAAFRPILRKLPIVKRIQFWKGSWWNTARDHILIQLVKPYSPVE